MPDQQINSARITHSREAMHRPVRCFDGTNGVDVMLNDVFDIVTGAGALAALLRWDEDRRTAIISSDTPSAEPMPLLDDYRRDCFQRLIETSLGMAATAIEHRMNTREQPR